MRTASEMACVMNRVIRTLGYAPCGVLGLGFGGWIAAEMAVQCPDLSKWLVLQAPVGIKPAAPEEIVDRFLFKEEEYVKMGFADPNSFSRHFGEVPDEGMIRRWDSAREMMTRVAYKPYMFSGSLRHLIVGLETPAMVVWGEGDRLVPRSCAQSYASAMARGSLVTTPGGHWLDLEHADEFSEMVTEFAGKTGEQTGQGKEGL
jgi:pimeloyl-ACP methyl ester carboxylesterase